MIWTGIARGDGARMIWLSTPGWMQAAATIWHQASFCEECDSLAIGSLYCRPFVLMWYVWMPVCVDACTVVAARMHVCVYVLCVDVCMCACMYVCASMELFMAGLNCDYNIQFCGYTS